MRRAFASASAKLDVMGLIASHNLAGEHVLVRVDFNVPMGADGDRRRHADTRRGADDRAARRRRQGRLQPMAQEEGGGLLRLAPAARRLGELPAATSRPPTTAWARPPARRRAPSTRATWRCLRTCVSAGGELCDFARLADASRARFYVNDAFGTAHRAHASTAGVPALPSTVQVRRGSRAVDFLVAAVDPQMRAAAVAVVGGSGVHEAAGALVDVGPRRPAAPRRRHDLHLLPGTGPRRRRVDRRGGMRRGGGEGPRGGPRARGGARAALDAASDFAVSPPRPSARAARAKYPRAGWGSTSGRTPSRSFRARSTARAPSCGTGPWASSSGRDSRGNAIASRIARPPTGCVSVIGGGARLGRHRAGLAGRMSHVSTGGKPRAPRGRRFRGGCAGRRVTRARGKGTGGQRGRRRASVGARFPLLFPSALRRRSPPRPACPRNDTGDGRLRAALFPSPARATRRPPRRRSGL